jgi:hypothetical protein
MVELKSPFLICRRLFSYVLIGQWLNWNFVWISRSVKVRNVLIGQWLNWNTVGLNAAGSVVSVLIGQWLNWNMVGLNAAGSDVSVNRTMVELKYGRVERFREACQRVNRTMVELKLLSICQINNFWNCVNRTMVELKYGRVERCRQRRQLVLIGQWLNWNFSQLNFFFEPVPGVNRTMVELKYRRRGLEFVRQ